MPPRKKAAAQTLSAHIDESSDDAAVVQEAPKKVPAKRASRAKPSTATKSTRGKKRATGEPSADEADPIEDDDMEDAVVVQEEPGAESKKRGKRASAKPEPAKKEPAKWGRGKKAPIEETEPEVEETEQTESEAPEVEGPTVAKRGAKKRDAPTATAVPEKKKRMTKKEKDTAAKEEAEREIAETQFTAMEVDLPSEHDVTEDEVAPTPAQVHKAGLNNVGKTAPAPASTTRGKGKGKKGDIQTEEDGEEDDLANPTNLPISLGRGRLGKKHVDGNGGDSYKDLEKAFQALQARYNNLQEVKETEAEQALKKFQKNMKEKDEERAKVIEALQNDLKSQQKAQEDFSAETKVLKKKLVAKETEASRLQSKVQELSKSLQDQQNESKMVTLKLSQAQNQLAQAQNQRNNAQVPGSAVKPGYRGPPGIPIKANTSGAADDGWIARVKEELYADLCGLLILNVKKENDSNVFECVQTGANGLSVHFKLSVPNQHTKAKKAPTTQESRDPADVETDENEIIFIPVFDEKRDKAVMDLLPTYLHDEISFQRDHMSKFYQKINSLFMISINAPKQAGSTEGEEESYEEDDDEEEEEEEEDEDEEK